ncbi:neprosin family prolyl endopeptidase [Krasilnikovia cinnamomea]|uniref:neprosin family prolyl endopeptidase n=1 Tax=Krasilnikovia cinnamomea TaxID=349313 RepID=UPI001F5FBB44|nr:neprosin family prolyl endopeptidase [Krasilnikovia cinnamomea]
MSISRRGLVAAGLAVVTVGSMSVVWTLNAGAAENPADVTAVASASAEPSGAATDPSTAGADPSTTGAAPFTTVDADPAGPDPAEDASTPPARLPWGGRPVAVTRAEPGANSAKVAAEGADIAPADKSGATQAPPEFSPKGRNSRWSSVRSTRTSVVAPVPPPLTEPVPRAGSQVNFLYGVGSQNAETDGAYANFSIAKPKLASGDFHTLAELSVQSADGAQIVEVGWTVDRTVNGDSDPHIFVYHWVNRKETCYNACGFVQYSQTVKPGDTLPEGGNKRFGIQHYNDAWWVAYDTEWLGYFPDSLWNGQFTRSGQVQFFGEVASPSTQPCSHMGNGLASDNASAARVGSVAYINGPEVDLNVRAIGGVYSVNKLSARTFRYGGPGAC